MSREAWAVVDLGFGDAGKGAVTDKLVRARQAELVVRFHGGAQAGHNVVSPTGQHHTFSQFGAGTLAGARTLLGPAMLIHPLAMRFEAEHLRALGVADPWGGLEVDARARVITPYQQAAGQVRERLRGAAAHGTCGVGVGECVQDTTEHPDDALRARDLADPARVRAALVQQRERKRAELIALGAPAPWLELFEDSGLVERAVQAWAEVADRLEVREPAAVAARIASAQRLVFEGAQGVLLDQTWGFHPHTTWSDCTLTEARALCDRPLTTLGVLRAWGIRHGPGPFPTASATRLHPEPHNGDDGWQGRFRTGALDGVLLRYALAVCGGVDGLAIAGLDRAPTGPVADSYAGPAPPGLARDDGDRVRELIPGEPEDLGHRERLGRWLFTARPAVQRADTAAFVAQASGRPVWLEGRGPRATDWSWTPAGTAGCTSRPSAVR